MPLLTQYNWLSVCPCSHKMYTWLSVCQGQLSLVLPLQFYGQETRLHSSSVKGFAWVGGGSLMKYIDTVPHIGDPCSSPLHGEIALPLIVGRRGNSIKWEGMRIIADWLRCNRRFCSHYYDSQSGDPGFRYRHGDRLSLPSFFVASLTQVRPLPLSYISLPVNYFPIILWFDGM